MDSEQMLDAEEIVKLSDFTFIFRALSEQKTFADIRVLIKSMKEHASETNFRVAMCALVHSFVRFNRNDLLCYALANYFDEVGCTLTRLLLYSAACGHYEITNVILVAGTDPFRKVNIELMLKIAPQEEKEITEMLLTLQGCEHITSCPYMSPWHIVLLRDDVAIFKQIYQQFPDVICKNVSTAPSHIPSKGVQTIYTLHEACLYRAHAILEHCLCNKIYQFHTDNEKALRTELGSLLSTSFQDLKSLKLLYHWDLLRADMENESPLAGHWDDPHIPANQLHHVMSSGLCPFLTKCFTNEHVMPVIQFNTRPYLEPSLPDVIEFLMEKGVQSDGSVICTTSYAAVDQSFIRPVTLIAVHIPIWLIITEDEQHPCSTEEYISLMHQVLDRLPSFKYDDISPGEINPLFFILTQTLSMVECAHSWLFSSEKCSDEIFLKTFQDALMIAEDLFLYFLKQDFKFCDDEDNIYTVVYHLFDKLEFFHINLLSQIKPTVWKDIREMLGYFFLKTLRYCLAYHDSVKRNTCFHEMLCHPYMSQLSYDHQLLEVLLSSSPDKEYYQILRDITEFLKIYEKDHQNDLAEFCEDLCSNPRKLKDMCRETIFNAVEAPVFQHVDQLPLPTELRLYVSEMI